MPVALAGLELLPLTLFVFLLAFLYSLKWTVTPLLRTLHSALGWVPGLGDLIGNAESAIITAINGAISGVESAISTLLHGLVWSFGLVAKGLEDLAQQTEAALQHAFTQSLPAAFKGLEAEMRKEITTVERSVTALAKSVRADLAEAKHYADRAAAAVEAKVSRYVVAQVGAAERLLRGEIATARHALEKEIGAARSEATRAAERYAREIVAGEHAALESVKHAEEATAARVTTAVAGAAAELPGLPREAWDELERHLGAANLATLAGLLAAVPLLRTMLRTLADEAGLNRPECRTKVRGVCTTDPNAWAHLLAGLAPFLLALEARRLAELGGELLHTLVPVVREVDWS